jgi:isopenicillin-N epimerase
MVARLSAPILQTGPVDSELARHWLLEPGLAFLNHGSYGACPIPVLQVQADLRARMERDPVRFLSTDLDTELERAREAVAAFLGANPADLAFVTNATTGVNTVLRSLETTFNSGDELLATDHEYNATINAMRFVAQRRGASVVIARIPFPVRSDDQVVGAILGAVTTRTRLALISHVTSATGLVFPIRRLVAELADRGVDSLVDAAHAPGMVPLDIGSLGAAYVTGNGHKWLCGPKGAGFLWVQRERQPLIRPLVISHGANAPAWQRTRFRLEADWTGTNDPTAVLSLPTAIEFMTSLHPDGWPGVMAANHALALAGRDELCAALRIAPPVPDDMLGSMAALPIAPNMPPQAHGPTTLDPDETLPDDPLSGELLARHRIQVPVGAWPPVPSRGPPQRLLRISAQRYNDIDDYRRLAAALVAMAT